jgi:large subunit ribosomal protein L21
MRPHRAGVGVCLMYAIIKAGGRQYSVSPNESVRVELLEGQPGDTVEFDQVVAISGDDGKIVAGGDLASAKVTATIEDHGRGKKLRIFKFKRRKMFRWHKGHRQDFTQVKINEILV